MHNLNVKNKKYYDHTHQESHLNQINDNKDGSGVKDDTKQTTNNILHKVDLILLNNSWNDKNEKIIISIGENAASYKWMHEQCAFYHKSIHNFISILMIVLTTSLSAEITIISSNNNETLNIIKQLVTYILTTVTVLQNFLKSQKLSEKHLIASNDFSKLYHDIQQQMCMFRRDRINATKYISDCLKLYDSLIINHPDISKYVINKFKKTFKNADISIPDIADRIQKIELITEPLPVLIPETENNLNQNKDSHTININNTNYADHNLNNLNNLSLIHNTFQIHGDVSDKDLENMDSIELQEIKKKILKNKLNYNYEYERFLQHSNEND